MSMVAWFNRDLWGPVWPNLAASTICGALVVVRVRVHLARSREAQSRQHAATRDLVSGLHERLDALSGERKETP
jgi:hypothetical protein